LAIADTAGMAAGQIFTNGPNGCLCGYRRSRIGFSNFKYYNIQEGEMEIGKSLIFTILA